MLLSCLLVGRSGNAKRFKMGGRKRVVQAPSRGWGNILALLKSLGLIPGSVTYSLWPWARCSLLWASSLLQNSTNSFTYHLLTCHEDDTHEILSIQKCFGDTSPLNKGTSPSFCKWGNRGTGKPSQLPKLPLSENGRVKIPTRSHEDSMAQGMRRKAPKETSWERKWLGIYIWSKTEHKLITAEAEW